MVTNDSWLEQQVNQRSVIPFRFQQHVWLLDHRCAVFWPQEKTLVVSDLHLEKGSYLSQYANPVPRYDSSSTLKKLSTLIDDYHPERVICLGDTFHDVSAYSRMIDCDIGCLTKMSNEVSEWIWILGNHDPAIPDDLPGLRMHTWQHSGLLFTHEPENQNTPQIYGHFHPKAKAKYGRLKMYGPCLISTEQHLVMPAFGQYTGGLNVDDPVFETVLDTRSFRGFVMSETRIVPFEHNN